MNRFQGNESQCSTPNSPSPGVEPGTWGWGPQILIYFINRHCSPPKCFPVLELNPALVGESHKSSPLDQLGVFTYQSLTLIRILVVCSLALNRFQGNESQCSTPKSPSPGVEPGTWGWGPQILIYFINRHCSPPKCFTVRELNPGLVGERHKSSPLDQLGVLTY